MFSCYNVYHVCHLNLAAEADGNVISLAGTKVLDKLKLWPDGDEKSKEHHSYIAVQPEGNMNVYS